MRNVHLQQTTVATLAINVHVTTRLFVYGNDVSFQEPIKPNSYPHSSGESPRGLPNGGSPRGRSLD